MSLLVFFGGSLLCALEPSHVSFGTTWEQGLAVLDRPAASHATTVLIATESHGRLRGSLGRAVVASKLEAPIAGNYYC